MNYFNSTCRRSVLRRNFAYFPSYKQFPHTLIHAHITCIHTHSLTHSRTGIYIRTRAHTHAHTHTHTLTHMHSFTHSRSLSLTPSHRQELLSAQDRISHLHERLAMSRLQSRGSTPSRPSPPDGGDFGGSHGGTAHYEVYGRHSPTKAAYVGRGLINAAQPPHRAASFHEHRNQGI